MAKVKSINVKIDTEEIKKKINFKLIPYLENLVEEYEQYLWSNKYFDTDLLQDFICWIKNGKR